MKRNEENWKQCFVERGELIGAHGTKLMVYKFSLIFWEYEKLKIGLNNEILDFEGRSHIRSLF